MADMMPAARIPNCLLQLHLPCVQMIARVLFGLDCIARDKRIHCRSQRTVDGKALHQGETVEVRGWVRTVRDQKQFCFMQVNDGSNMSGIQVVVEPGAAGFELIADGKVQTGGRCGQAWLHITLQQLHTTCANVPRWPLHTMRHVPTL